MSIDYEKQREYFDNVARQTVLSRMPTAYFQRYAHPRWPQLFAKEMMFVLAGTLRGKEVLEVGCGEGIASVQLAYCGAHVHGIDISPVSIEVARARAQLNDQAADFVVGDFIRDDLFPPDTFDVVWCDLILHHLVGSLEVVTDRIWRYLKPGGLFIAREPVAYAAWLKRLRRLMPVPLAATPDEQPLRREDFQVICDRFPDLHRRYYRILARADRVTGNLSFLRFLARLDNVLLKIPASTGVAGNVVLWSRKAAS